MRKIEVYRNGEYVKLPAVMQGFSVRETNDETLDQALFVYYGPAMVAVKRWDSIKITVNNYECCFLAADVQTDYLRASNKYTVTLIEPTKYLEKIICPSMSFTNRNDNLLDQIEKALLNAEPVEVGKEPRFKLSDKVKETLAEVPGADFFFEKSTLREILDGFGSKIDSRVIVKEITDYSDIVVDFANLNERKNRIDLANCTRRTVENIEYQAGEIESYTENAVSGSQQPIWQPSIAGWNTFKTNEAALTTGNASIVTAFPVEEIKKVVVRLPVPLVLKGYNQGGATDLYSTYEIDITKNVVDEETYRVLHTVDPTDAKFSEDLYQENTIMFERGSTDAQLKKYKFRIFFRSSNIEGAVYNALWNSPEVRAIKEQGEYSSYGITAITFPPIAQVLYRIQYVPRINAHLRVGKEDYSGPTATIISQQGDKIVDLGSYGDNLYGLINRVGNQELVIEKVHKTAESMYQLGDYTDENYVLTSREIAVYNDLIRAKYDFTKNYNAFSTKIGIDRRKRIYNIPTEYFKSDALVKEYIVASIGNTSNYDPVIARFMGGFLQQTYLPFNLALVKTYWQGGESDWIELPAASFYAGNTVNFYFTFLDNYSAGMSIGNQVLGGKKVIPNPYVNEFGEYNEIEIRLLNDAGKYPAANNDPEVAKLLPKTELHYYIGIQPYIRRFRRYKDAYEHHSYTICFGIMSADPQIIIIGPGLVENCSLIKTASYLTANELRVYLSYGEKYGFGDRKVKGVAVEESAASIVVNEGYITVLFPPVSGLTAWAIGDTNRNLFIGCNNPEVRSIQFELKKSLL